MHNRTLRLLLEYDGTPYVGWQYQPGLPTVEGHLLEAMARVLGEQPALAVAGRTDCGVHAMGQVVSFSTQASTDAFRLAPSLNAHLPPTISVHRVEDAPPHFHARHSAISKRYRYRIYHARQHAALERGRAWYVPHRIDAERMHLAAQQLIGELDFESYRSAQCDAEHARRHMYSIDVTAAARLPLGTTIEITFHANAFCRHMCRILAGTLTEVGTGRRSIESIRDILHARDRTRAGMTAPPEGLTMLEVIYPDPQPGEAPMWQVPGNAP